eukprot:TRINITY_DN2885_c0_g1_i3.p1 TRINITY_DN2885_c0_g1~~TRINITY_DN2885_c0_g1_i3.p1  ORF type:complete len:306 (+),score=75.84 TRINITY_DN2885_c0_g1_i3:283-1200(+)
MLVHRGRLLPLTRQQPVAAQGLREGDTVHVVPFASPMFLAMPPAPPNRQLAPRPEWVEGLRNLQRQTGKPVLAQGAGQPALGDAAYEALMATADLIFLVSRHIKQQASNMRALLYTQKPITCSVTPLMRAAPALLATLEYTLAEYTRQPLAHRFSAAEQCVHSCFVACDLRSIAPVAADVDTSEDERTRKQFVLYSDTDLPERCLSATELAADWKQHEHHCITYHSLSLFHLVTATYCIKTLAASAALVLFFAPEKNMRIAQSLDDAGINTKALLDAKRLVLVDNDVYMNVHCAGGFTSWALTIT